MKSEITISCEVWIERTKQCTITRVVENPLNKQRNLFTNYHTTNKCTNCMSFIFKSLF